MNDLRISLIVISVLAIILVYLLSWINRRQVRGSAERRFEPSLNADRAAEINAADGGDFEIKIGGDGEDRLLFPEQTRADNPIPAFAVKRDAAGTTEPPAHMPTHDADSSSPPATQDTSRRAAPERIVVLNVVAREGRPFRGDSIARTLDTLGLELGAMDFFQSYDVDEAGRRRSVFSVASMVKPGTFDRATLPTYSTPGLALFMQIPGALAASEAFDAMHECAGSIAVRLGGTVCDEHRAPLTPHRAREIREALLSQDFSEAVRQAPGFSAGERQ